MKRRFATIPAIGLRALNGTGTGMVLINCDMGESFGLWRMGEDALIMPVIDIANVACGFHASDFNHMRATVRLAKQHGVKVGAHPSLPDLQGFGRREMRIGREELANCLIYQIGALKGFLDVRYGARDGSACAEFSWEGHDENDPACGCGWAAIGTAGRLVGHFYIHNGDESGFVCERV